MALLFAGASSAAAQLYMWTDEHGVTHLVDTPPPSATPARRLDIQPAPRKAPQAVPAPAQAESEPPPPPPEDPAPDGPDDLRAVNQETLARLLSERSEILRLLSKHQRMESRKPVIRRLQKQLKDVDEQLARLR